MRAQSGQLLWCGTPLLGSIFTLGLGELVVKRIAIAKVSAAFLGACVTATVYPYVIYPAILRLLPARPAKFAESRSDNGKEFALLFCAYNESSAMPGKIENLRKLLHVYPELEIWVYDDASSDGTADLLDQSDLRIRVIRGRGRTGKAHGMKLLASLTEREYLVFTDANVELESDVFDRLFSTYSDPAVGGVCGQLKYADATGAAVAHAGGLYWRLEEVIKTLESRSGNVMGADGSIFSIRKFLYPDFPDTVLDDMTVSMEVLFRGFRLLKDPRVVAHERLVTSTKDDYTRRLRIATRVFHTHMTVIGPRLGTLPLADRWRWWSHRYVKWHGAFFVMGGYVSAATAFGATVGVVPAIAAGVTTAAIVVSGTRFDLGPLSALAHVLSSILLSGVGVVQARKGHTVTTWQPPATR